MSSLHRDTVKQNHTRTTSIKSKRAKSDVLYHKIRAQPLVPDASGFLKRAGVTRPSAPAENTPSLLKNAKDHASIAFAERKRECEQRFPWVNLIQARLLLHVTGSR